MSRCAPDRNVSINPVVVAWWKCVKSPSLAISEGCGKRGTVPSFHAFHQTGISAAANGCFQFEAWSVNSSRCFLVTEFLAVGHDLRLVLKVLLRFNKRESMAKAFVLDDGGMADALVLTEDTIGK